jgi:hypothetical protein
MQSKTYISLTAQTIYVILIGLQLIFVPNMLLNIFGIAPTSEIWIKILGIILLSLSFIYHKISKSEDRDLVQSTIWARLLVCLGFVALVITGQTVPTLILFAGIDLATSIWTWLELKK